MSDFKPINPFTVTINTFDDGNQPLAHLPNRYMVTAVWRDKYMVTGNGRTFSISAWKVSPIHPTFNDLPPGTRVVKVNTRITKENVGKSTVVRRHEPAHTWMGVPVPDGVWVSFDHREFGETLCALTDVQIMY